MPELTDEEVDKIVAILNDPEAMQVVETPSIDPFFTRLLGRKIIGILFDEDVVTLTVATGDPEKRVELYLGADSQWGAQTVPRNKFENIV